VKVGFVDLDSLEPREIAFIGTEAVVMQHEIDHHDGRLFVDRANIPFKAEKKIGPNEPCPCRSGKKFKKCCMK
jgi:peptide deformylase